MTLAALEKSTGSHKVSVIEVIAERTVDDEEPILSEKVAGNSSMNALMCRSHFVEASKVT